MLRSVQAYIADRGTVSVADLSVHFHTDREALRPMLAKLHRKGRIRKLPASEKCTGCTCCSGESLELYAWADG